MTVSHTMSNFFLDIAHKLSNNKKIIMKSPGVITYSQIQSESEYSYILYDKKQDLSYPAW